MNAQYKNSRTRLFVDRIQTALVYRVLFILIGSTLFVTLPLAFLRTIFSPEQVWFAHLADIWQTHWQVFAMMLLIVPFVVYDLLKFSHRFAGPMSRLRRELDNAVNSRETLPVRFRDHDYWGEIGDNCTRLIERNRVLEKRLAELTRVEKESVEL